MQLVDFFNSLGLPYRLVEDPKFRKLIMAAKNIPSSYKWPNRQRVGGDLLKLQYETQQKKTDAKLLSEAQVYGISFFGDGATVRKMPLFNILASCGDYTTTLEIYDCSKHMAVGGIKDAVFISEICETRVQRLDPKGDLCDVWWFDGASNCRKAGRIREALNPRATVLHGVEHVCSLIFEDFSAEPEIKLMIKLSRTIQKYFGSGSMHSPYAIFMKFSEMNFGRKIGLVKPADTRMAGHWYSWHRTHRLRHALTSTLTSPEFKKLKVADNLSKFLQQDRLWEVYRVLLAVAEPILNILRLADSRQPGMDRLYFYIRMADRLLEKHSSRLDTLFQKDGVTILQLSEVVKYPGKTGQKGKSIDDEEEDPGTETVLVEPDLDSDDDVSVDSMESNESEDEEEKNEEERDKDEKNEEEKDEDKGEDGSRASSVLANVTLGERLRNMWYKRRKSLVSDFAHAGWILCPKAEVMEDVKDNMNRETRRCVDNLFKKLMCPVANGNKEEEARMLNTFWREHDDFLYRKGVFGDRDYIWVSSEQSHVWHKINSLRDTEYLGSFACRVLSKRLGIGEAERCWGAVKHLKKDKRGHLSGKVVNMQATLFGSYSAQKARLKREKRKNLMNLKEDKILSDEDFEQDFILEEKAGLASPRKPKAKRILRCWLEDWEEVAVKKMDPVSQAQLLKKYGGLIWWDPDSKKMFKNAEDKLHWQKKTRRKDDNTYGYCVLAYREDYNEDDMATYDYMAIEKGCMLHTQLYNYYKKHPHDGLVIYQNPAEISATEYLTEEEPK